MKVFPVNAYQADDQYTTSYRRTRPNLVSALAPRTAIQLLPTIGCLAVISAAIQR